MNPYADRAGAATVIFAATGLTLAAAGCGGSPGAHVAQLSSTATHSDFTGSAASARLSGPTRSRFGSALVGAVGLLLLVSACGGSPPSGVARLGTGPSTTGQTAALAFSRCMRAHGVPKFPDPDAQGELPQVATGVPKQIAAAADGACKRLLSRGGSAGTPQNRQAKVTFALAVARCLRSHGFPNFPDPSVSSQGISENLSGAGIDSSSQQFQAAETTCEKQERGRR